MPLTKTMDLGTIGTSFGETLNGGLSKVTDYVKENPKILPALLAGTAGGVAGGYLTSRAPESKNETPGARRMRILRNALLSGGAAAGAVGLAQLGAKELQTALPVDDVDPTTSFLTGPVPRGAAVLGVGAALRKGGIRAEEEVRDEFLTRVMNNLSKNKNLFGKGNTTDPTQQKLQGMFNTAKGISGNVGGGSARLARSKSLEDLYDMYQRGMFNGHDTAREMADGRRAVGMFSQSEKAPIRDGVRKIFGAEGAGNKLREAGSLFKNLPKHPSLLREGRRTQLLTRPALAIPSLIAAGVSPEIIKILWGAVTGGEDNQ